MSDDETLGCAGLGGNLVFAEGGELLLDGGAEEFLGLADRGRHYTRQYTGSEGEALDSNGGGPQ